MANWGSLVLGQVTPPNRRGKGQGYFRYYRTDGTFDAIVAVNGKLIRNGGDLPITGLASGFQKERMIEAVQYFDKLYVATGTQLIVYDGVTATTVTPYQPNTLEALYVGTNALSPTPDEFIQDSEGVTISLDGVTVDKTYGIVNQPTTFKVYGTKPTGVTLKYRFYYKLKKADTFLPTDAAWQDSNTFIFTPVAADEYEMKFQVRNSTVPDTQVDGEYYLPSYVVNRYDQNTKPDVSGIPTCNRILLHWDRLILYGDTKNLSTIYISHIKQANYFPTNNTLIFETDKQEPLIKLVQFRDFLVAFLSGSIQALYGKSPQEYRRVRVNTGVGCIASETPAVFGNYIAFLSKDGVYILRSVGTTDSQLNVQRIDTKIMNLIPPYPETADACGIHYHDQYMICFPKQKIRLRYYRLLQGWAKDESPHFDFCRFYEWRGDLVAQSQSLGEVYKFDEDTYDDLGHIYESSLETKAYDLGTQYNPKKLRELQVLVGHEKHDVELEVYVYGDASEILTTDTSYIDIENGVVKFHEQHPPNLESEAGTIFGEWDLGKDGFGEIRSRIHKMRLVAGRKYRTVRVAIKHNEAEPWSLLGLGFKFKLKKP